MIRFIRHQYRYGCSVGLGRRQALTRAITLYRSGF